MNAPHAKKRVLLAYSGGLDTSFLVAHLVRERGFDVTALTVDCGGFDDEQRRAVAARAVRLGATEHRWIDARPELFDRVVRWLIAGNVRRGDTYPLCVAAERGLQAEILARVARDEGFDAVAHGCTGAGNDQIRFEAALSIVAEGVPVLAPIRDGGFDRAEERDALRSWGFECSESEGRYSVNAGLWGLTIGGGELLGSTGALPEDEWRWTRGVPEEAPAAVEVAFEEGCPVALDGVALDPVELIEQLNALAGAAGVGRGYHLGDTVLGHKGRIAYEAPAAEVLLDAHRELEKLVLTEDQRFWKEQLGDTYGRALHQGRLHEPMMRDVEAFLASSQRRVTGTVTVRLAGGRALVEGLESPYSMLAASDARYGERAASHTDPAGAVQLARTLAEPARLARRAGERAAAATGALPAVHPAPAAPAPLAAVPAPAPAQALAEAAP